MHTYVTVPPTPQSCLVNIMYSGTPPKPTSILAGPNGTFLLNPNGGFIIVESPVCLPYTDESVQTITVANNWPEKHRHTSTIYLHEYGYSSSSMGFAPAYYHQGMSAGELAGIIVGCISALAIISAIAILCWCRRRKSRREGIVVEPEPKDSRYSDFETSWWERKRSKKAPTTLSSKTLRDSDFDSSLPSVGSPEYANTIRGSVFSETNDHFHQSERNGADIYSIPMENLNVGSSRR